MLSVPVAWMWPSGSGEIQTSAQAGGIRSARIRSSVAASLISAPARSRYRKPSPALTRGDAGTVRVAAHQAGDGGGQRRCFLAHENTA